MRILRITASVDPEQGGVVEAIRSTTCALGDLGHETEIATLDDPTASFLSRFPAPVHASGSWIGRYGYTPMLRRWVRNNAERFDVAVIDGLWNHATIGGYQGLRDSRLPYVLFPHGMMDPWFRERYPVKHVAKQLFWTLLQGRVLRDARAVAFTCEEECRLGRGVFRGPAYSEAIVPIGIAEPPLPDVHVTGRDSLPNYLNGRRYFLFMSRLHPKKGCDLLIRAFATLVHRHPEEDLDLVMAGPDQVGWQAELVKLSETLGVAHRIHWPGMLVGARKWTLLRDCEAFVLPSHQENFGLVVAEAMACCRPVLTTDKVNIWREIAASGGGLIENDTENGIGRLLSRWIALSPTERQAMGRTARDAYVGRFRIDAAIGRFANLLKETATGAGT